jgi:hypothetical protein
MVVERSCSTTSAGSGAGAAYELVVVVVVFCCVTTGRFEHAATKVTIRARITMAFFMIFSFDG